MFFLCIYFCESPIKTLTTIPEMWKLMVNHEPWRHLKTISNSKINDSFSSTSVSQNKIALQLLFFLFWCCAWEVESSVTEKFWSLDFNSWRCKVQPILLQWFSSKCHPCPQEEKPKKIKNKLALPSKWKSQSPMLFSSIISISFHFIFFVLLFLTIATTIFCYH